MYVEEDRYHFPLSVLGSSVTQNDSCFKRCGWLVSHVSVEENHFINLASPDIFFSYVCEEFLDEEARSAQKADCYLCEFPLKENGLLHAVISVSVFLSLQWRNIRCRDLCDSSIPDWAYSTIDWEQAKYHD